MVDTKKQILRMANRYLGRIGQRVDNHFTFDAPEGDGTPCVMIDDEGYHYVLSERGNEFERRTTKDINLLMYWIARDVVSRIAYRHIVKNPKGLEQRCVAFMRKIELMRKIDVGFEEKLKQDISLILKDNPFIDNPLQAHELPCPVSVQKVFATLCDRPCPCPPNARYIENHKSEYQTIDKNIIQKFCRRVYTFIRSGWLRQ